MKALEPKKPSKFDFLRNFKYKGLPQELPEVEREWEEKVKHDMKANSKNAH